MCFVWAKALSYIGFYPGLKAGATKKLLNLVSENIVG